MRDLKMPPQRYQLPQDTGRTILLDYYKGEPDFLVHYHPEYELVMTRGSFGRRLIGDTVSSYSRIDLVLLGPELPHTWAAESAPDNAGPLDNFVVHFSRESLGLELLEKPECARVNAMLHACRRGLHFRATGLIETAEAQLLQIQALEGTGLPQFLTFLRLLDTMSRDEHPVQLASDGYDCSQIDHDHEPFARVLTYLHAHGCHPLTLDQIARHANMSVPTFCRFFKRVTGTTFADYINGWRIDRACIFLTETDQSVLDISLHVGFPNLSNFNRQFKRRMGMTPREYRQRSRGMLPRLRPA